MEAAPLARPALVRPRVRARPGIRTALVGIVGVSALAHVLVAWLQPIPVLFPDEYLYTELGRSIASSGAPLVRGGSAHFPALLQPALTAPLWWLHDIGLSYHAIQALNAIAFALAAVPTFLIARRLNVANGMALSAAALAVCGPQLLLSNAILAEPFAYPLAIFALWAALAQMERPTRRSAVLFVGLAACAAATRVQLAVLPLCALAAVVVVGVRERRVLATLRRQRVVVAVAGLEVLAAVAFVLFGRVGYYRTLPLGGVHALRAVRMAGADLYVLVFAAGMVTAPAAVVGLARGFFARSRTEAAFSALALAFIGAILAEAVLYGDASLVQERYLIYVVPLVAVAFAARVVSPGRRAAEGAVAAVIALTAALVPLSGYAHAAAQSVSPVLFALDRLERAFHDAGTASLVAAVLATLLAAVAALVAGWRSSSSRIVVVGLALVASTAVFAASASFERAEAIRVRHVLLPPDASWVDHAHVGPVALLAATGIPRDPSLETLFWNPSIDRVLLMPATAPIDAFRRDDVSIRPDGELRASGRPVTESLLVDERETTVRLRRAHRVETWGTQTLWQFHSPAQLSSVFVGRTASGALLPIGALLLWGENGRLHGWLELRVRATGKKDATLRLRPQHGSVLSVSLKPHATRTVRIPICTSGSWQAAEETKGDVEVSVPAFASDPNACNRR